MLQSFGCAEGAKKKSACLPANRSSHNLDPLESKEMNQSQIKTASIARRLARLSHEWRWPAGQTQVY
jgi:hypothetical protein